MDEVRWTNMHRIHRSFDPRETNRNFGSVLGMVALSGGFAREEASDRLRRNHGVAASFSGALVTAMTII